MKSCKEQEKQVIFTEMPTFIQAMFLQITFSTVHKVENIKHSVRLQSPKVCKDCNVAST